MLLHRCCLSVFLAAYPGPQGGGSGLHKVDPKFLLLHFSPVDPEVLPGHKGHIIPPACSGFTLRSKQLPERGE